MPDPLASQLLYQALSTPLGIVVIVENFDTARAKLYAARRAAGDPALACLQVRRSPTNPNTEIWIVKGGQVEIPKQEEPEFSPGPENLQLDDLL